jgi:hypothetical protein
MNGGIVTFNISMILIVSSLSGIAQSNILKDDTSKESALCTKEITVTIHTLSGCEQKTAIIPMTILANSSKEPLSYDQIISCLSEEDQRVVTQQITKDKQTLSRYFDQMEKSNGNSNRVKQDRIIKRLPLPINDSFVNYLCKVKGVGLLFLFPPFLPITPILWAGLLIFNTNGTMGEINRAVEQALMIPFVGISFWAETYVFAGFAGIAMGWNTTDE